MDRERKVIDAETRPGYQRADQSLAALQVRPTTASLRPTADADYHRSAPLRKVRKLFLRQPRVPSGRHRPFEAACRRRFSALCLSAVAGGSDLSSFDSKWSQPRRLSPTVTPASPSPTSAARPSRGRRRTRPGSGALPGTSGGRACPRRLPRGSRRAGG